MRFVIAIMLSACAVQAGAETKFYQCKDKWGQPVFSERPCGADATEGSVEGPQEQGTVQVDFSNIRASGHIRDKEREIERHEGAIKRLENERDLNIAELQLRSTRTYNSLAGATLRDSYATEMNATTAQYNSKLEAERGKIEQLRSEIQALESTQAADATAD